jgi:hypothetical protein
VTNLLQKLVADGLDKLDEEDGARELVKNTHELLRHVAPERVKDALAWQKRLLDEVRRGKPPHVIDPPPPAGMTRRRKHKRT